MNSELLVFGAALMAAGLSAGFIGGLFGVGGGVIIVPALYYVFGALGVDDSVRMHVSVGTSLACIIVTSWRSLRTHAKAGAVDFQVLRTWCPWIAIGAIVGAGLAGFASQIVLLGVFGAGLLLVALQMGMGQGAWRLADELPQGAMRAGMGGGLGVLSAMMGIGGGAFGVTIMTMFGRAIHQSVATASGFGAAIAAPGAIGFIVSGWGAAGAPPFSLGYVNIAGFVGLSLMTALAAPFGARLAHRLDQALLRRLFAIFLGLTALNMVREALMSAG